MIDELVLEQLLAEIGEEIEVPAGGAERVAHELRTSGRAPRGPAPRYNRLAMIAAAVVVLVVLGMLIHGATNGSSARTSLAPVSKERGRTSNGGALPTASGVGQGNTGLKGVQGPTGAQGPSPEGDAELVGPQGGTGTPGVLGVPGPQGPQGLQGLQGDEGIIGVQGPTGAAGAQGVTAGTARSGAAQSPSASGLIDGAMVVKNASLSLQVPKGGLQSAVIGVGHVASGVGGYVSKSQTNFGGPDGTAALVLRVPVNTFEHAVTQLEKLPDMKLLDDTESGLDVTGQVVNLQAKLTADDAERDSFLAVLAQANNINDILTVHDRITEVQTEINQIQGEINVLSNQAALSSISILLSVPPPHAPRAAAVRHVSPPTGLAKSWANARQGFANSVEWFLSRSGGALIILLIGLMLVFALRYLYPVVRRALV